MRLETVVAFPCGSHSAVMEAGTCDAHLGKGPKLDFVDAVDVGDVVDGHIAA